MTVAARVAEIENRDSVASTGLRVAAAASSVPEVRGESSAARRGKVGETQAARVAKPANPLRPIGSLPAYGRQSQVEVHEGHKLGDKFEVFVAPQFQMFTAPVDEKQSNVPEVLKFDLKANSVDPAEDVSWSQAGSGSPRRRSLWSERRTTLRNKWSIACCYERSSCGGSKGPWLTGRTSKRFPRRVEPKAISPRRASRINAVRTRSTRA